MDNDLRVGIVGVKSVGATHARALLRVDGVRVTAWSGGDAGSGSQLGWPGARWMSHDELVQDGDVDIVVLCSPSEFHGAAAIAVAQSGRHVVVEKPMALTVADAQRLVSLQESGPGIVAMVAQRRFESENQAVKRLLERGDLGDVRLAHVTVPWFRTQEYFAEAPWRSRATGGGGSLANQGVHSIDLLQWFCGPIRSVTAQSATLALPLEVEDTVVATVSFASGALGTVCTSTATPPGFPATLTLHTNKGMIALGQGEVLSWEIPGVPRPASGPSAPSGSSDPAAIGLAGHVAVWQDIIGAIREGRRPLVDAVQGAGVTRLICAIHEAASSMREVTLAELV